MDFKENITSNLNNLMLEKAIDKGFLDKELLLYTDWIRPILNQAFSKPLPLNSTVPFAKQTPEKVIDEQGKSIEIEVLEKRLQLLKNK
jgi:hypothetical protein